MVLGAQTHRSLIQALSLCPWQALTFDATMMGELCAVCCALYVVVLPCRTYQPAHQCFSILA